MEKNYTNSRKNIQREIDIGRISGKKEIFRKIDIAEKKIKIVKKEYWIKYIVEKKIEILKKKT